MTFIERDWGKGGVVRAVGTDPLTPRLFPRKNPTPTALMNNSGSNLAVLILDQTSISDKGLLQLTEMGKLGKIDVSYTQVTDDGLKELDSLPRIRWLELGHTGVTDSGLQAISKCKTIDYLDLESTAITDEGLTHIQGLKRLRHLNVAQTAISNDGLVNLKELRRLTKLKLDGTSVSDAGLIHLYDVNRELRISVENTNVTVEGLGAYFGARVYSMSYDFFREQLRAENVKAVRFRSGHAYADLFKAPDLDKDGADHGMTTSTGIRIRDFAKLDEDAFFVLLRKCRIPVNVVPE